MISDYFSPAPKKPKMELPSPLDPIDPDRSGEEGVIVDPLLPLDIKEPKQAPLRNKHFITWYYGSVDEIDPVIARCKELCSKGIAQTEICPETKRKHIHLMLWGKGKSKFRDTALKMPKRDGKITWRSFPLKDVDNDSDYANKEKSHDGVFRTKWGFPPELRLITPTKLWQLQILELFTTQPDDRKMYWFWSRAGGVGKSSFAKYCVVKENCLFFEEGKKADIMHLIFEAPEERMERMIIDVPRANGNRISYKALESIKNGLIYSSKYEGGYKYFNPPHIVIFANEPPERGQMSEDKFVVINIDNT